MNFFSILISFLALLFSIIIYFLSDRKIKKQAEMINNYQIRFMRQNEEDNKKAVIRAQIIYEPGGKRKLFIWNKGKSKAHNITVTLTNSEQVYASNPDFPVVYSELLPDAHREILIFLSEGDDELTLNYIWDDDFKSGNEETQTIDL